MVYEWTGDYCGRGIPAEVAGKECEKLSAENRLTAKNLVDVSRPEDAPLHRAFEWDNAVAAEKWRENQASHMIRCLIIRDNDKEKEEAPPVKAFYVIERGTNKYEPTTVILKDEDKQKKLMEIALGELRAFKNKYRNLLAFKNLIAEIDNILASQGGTE